MRRKTTEFGGRELKDNLERLESLLIDWETGTLSDKDRDEVRQILHSDPEARKFFARHQVIGVALKLEGDAGLDFFLDNVVQHSTRPDRKSFRISYLFATLALLLICLLIGRLFYLELTSSDSKTVAKNVTSEQKQRPSEAMSSGVALLTNLVDIRWATDQSPLDIGDALSPGSFSIMEGLAQVEFFCGATVILEGPAKLEIKSPNLARVHQGNLRAIVPPAARGFSIEVEDMKVVDLGTEFGLSVSDEGASIQVFDGEIELHGKSEVQKNLIAGQALLRTVEGKLHERIATPEKFVDIAALEAQADDQSVKRFDSWKEYSSSLQSDPRVVAYYAFDQQGSWNRTLQNKIQDAVSELDGAIVGANRVVGRWDSKGALEFKRPGDRVRVNIPGEFGSLTFACWVRIDSLDRWFNSLFLTDNYNKGEPHWQILDTGQIYFSVRPAAQGETGPRDQKFLSPPFWKPSMSGKWLHIATTYDINVKLTTHYLNGKAIHSEAIKDRHLVESTRIGVGSIGNWSLPTQPDARFAIRNLNGRMDEFVILSAALSAEEINDMYNNGKP